MAYLTNWVNSLKPCDVYVDYINIGLDNGLSPGRHQAIVSTNAGILSIEHLGTNCNDFFIEIEIL